MSNDNLAKRLRSYAGSHAKDPILVDEAADHIEALTARLAEMEAERDRWKSIAQNEYAENEINRDWMKSAEARVKELEAWRDAAALKWADAAYATKAALDREKRALADHIIETLGHDAAVAAMKKEKADD
jgi:hypothetical protein